MLVSYDEEISVLKDDNEFLRTENTKLKNEMKVSRRNSRKLQRSSSIQDDDGSIFSSISSCCCCTTTIREMAKVQEEMVSLNTKIKELKGLGKSPHSSPSITPTVHDVVDNHEVEEFKWEKHSSGAARKVLNKMGYTNGKGLGKNEDGIVEALTVTDVTGK